MTTKPTKKRKATKMSAPAKFLVGATSIGTLIGGWGIMGYASAQSDNQASANVPSTEQSVANLLVSTALPLPTLAPLPTLETLPPIPTLAPMAITLPTPIQGQSASVSGSNDGVIVTVPTIPTLAPLPAMPAPPPPPPPAPRPSNGGGGGGGGGGGNVTTGS